MAGRPNAGDAQGEAQRAADSAPLVLPLSALGRGDLEVAGGKAANLGELLRAGLAVPPGFCLTTTAYARGADAAGLGPLLEHLAATPSREAERLASLAAELRGLLLGSPIPADVARAVREALDAFGAPEGPLPVAVRSSATAEDLPFASFAGQQDSALNLVGADAVLEAVRRCWASLWTERAVTYRAHAGIDPRTVRLAVVVQRLVDAVVAGVLFTADPLSGRRNRAVIDASPGLGEAVVSGAVNPDHFVVDAITGELLEQRLGDRRLAVLPAPGGGTRQVQTEAAGAPTACLPAEQLRALARLGQRVEAHFSAPQDLEFALDRAGALWLVQARPITTLFPLPDAAPRDPSDLRVYFNFNVFQGVFRPFTPMGIQALRLIFGSLATMFGATPPDSYAGPPFAVEAAGRLFGDVTGLVRSTAGRRLAAAALGQAEARSGPLLQVLLADPRLSPRPVAWRHVLPRVLRLLGATQLPLRLPAALLAPASARRSLDRLRQEISAAGAAPPGASAEERLDHAGRLLRALPRRIAPRVIPPLIAGLGSFALAGRLLGDLATPEERDAIRRALPHNPTTEMNLALWALARRARADGVSARALGEQPTAVLAAAHRSGDLPPVLQRGLTAFLARYGHRAVAEIDLGLPRWAEDPSPLLDTLASYLALGAAQPPDAQFRAAAAEAEVTIRALVQRASERNRLRGLAVRFLLGRGRALAGLREMPKFLLVLLLAQARALIGSAGEELTRSGRLEQADDVFFLTLPEVRAALRAVDDSRARVRERRARYQAELGRRHLPRLLLSDGTEPRLAEPLAEEGEVLQGTAASAGQASGRARVILDPAGARLEPGEILVAPSTDPGWTPLFLTAAAMVMEMGGAMSHGAVVAREYGIPAVVGVPGATERIRDGQAIVVDGTAGVVRLQRPGH